MIKKIFVVAPGVIYNGHTGDSVHLTKLWSSISNLNDVNIHLFSPAVNIKDEAIKFHNSFYKRTNSTLFNIFALLFSIISIYLKLVFILVLSDNPEIIYSRHQVINPAFLMPKNKRIKYILEVNGFFATEIKSQGIRTLNLFSNFIKKIELHTFKKADKIIVVAPVMKDTLVSKYGINNVKIKVITNGVDINIFHPKLENPNNLGLLKDKKYICFVGNLIPWQGLETIIKSAKKIKMDLPDYHYLIVGCGILKKKLIIMAKKYGVSDNIIFVGKVPHEKVVDYINVSEFCLAPFARERNETVGFSAIKIFEYLACGKPVIASNIRGNNLEIITDNDFGYLIDPDDPQMLTNKIIEIANDQNIINNTKNKGYNFIKQNYSWNNIALNIYNEIIQ